MKEAISVFYSKKLVFFLFILFVFIGGILLMSSDKETFHLILNRYHNSFFDMFFKYATYLGDGIIFPIVIVGLLVFNRKDATAFIISGIMTLIISYVLKNWVFIDFARPYEVFGDQLHIVEGVKMRRWHSFPSGHTTAAFALFMLAIFYSRKIGWQLFFFLLALIAGLSRVYLSQHFLQDVLGGAILGTSIALISYQLATRYPFFKK
ncbi:MAG TPA: phosphatase PAP2 family protein [Lutibacter sp.]|nr:phosphatase PAP2 family protein [Lutibacter sp.]